LSKDLREVMKRTEGRAMAKAGRSIEYPRSTQEASCAGGTNEGTARGHNLRCPRQALQFSLIGHTKTSFTQPQFSYACELNFAFCVLQSSFHFFDKHELSTYCVPGLLWTVGTHRETENPAQPPWLALIIHC
jgi:hypothetical protein